MSKDIGDDEVKYCEKCKIRFKPNTKKYNRKIESAILKGMMIDITVCVKCR